MKDYLISMFVDNELDIDEKIEFVETVHDDRFFKEEAVLLLEQEKMLQGDMVATLPHVTIPVVSEKESWDFRSWFLPMTGFVTAMVVVAMVYFQNSAPAPISSPALAEHRFVIYRPDVNKVELVGDFTQWTPVPMEKIGESGYWTTKINLPQGEHRYSYFVDNDQQMPDPTVLAHEQDDFGGVNSIIRVVGSI